MLVEHIPCMLESACPFSCACCVMWRCGQLSSLRHHHYLLQRKHLHHATSWYGQNLTHLHRSKSKQIIKHKKLTTRKVMAPTQRKLDSCGQKLISLSVEQLERKEGHYQHQS